MSNPVCVHMISGVNIRGVSLASRCRSGGMGVMHFAGSVNTKLAKDSDVDRCELQIDMVCPHLSLKWRQSMAWWVKSSIFMVIVFIRSAMIAPNMSTCSATGHMQRHW